MEANDILKLVGSGTALGALLFLLYLVGSRMVAAIDRVAVKVDDQGQRIVAIDSKLDAVLDERARGEERRTPSRGVPTAYAIHGSGKPR